jgi:hypothetical protein
MPVRGGRRLAAGALLLAACLESPPSASEGGGDGGSPDGAEVDAALDIPGPTDGLVAYWPMDGISGNRLIDRLGRHDGECASCPWDYAGVLGQSLRFRGQDAIVVPTDPDLAGPEGSISAWIFVEGPVDGTILSKPLGGGDTSSWLLGIVPDGSVLFEWPQAADFTETGVITIDSWHHVAATWSDEGRQIAVDGDVTVLAPEPAEYDSSDLVIGADRDSGTFTYQFPGAIDELRLYDRPLSLAEIGELAAF